MVTAVDPLLNTYRPLPHFQPEAFPGVDFRQMLLERMNEVAAYDQIFCLNVINHVSDMPLVLRQLRRALKPGGLCWISVDAHHYPFLQPVFAAIPGDILHPHQYTRQQYEELAGTAGFRLLDKQLLKPGGLFDYWMFKLTV